MTCPSIGRVWRGCPGFTGPPSRIPRPPLTRRSNCSVSTQMHPPACPTKSVRDFGIRPGRRLRARSFGWSRRAEMAVGTPAVIRVEFGRSPIDWPRTMQRLKPVAPIGLVGAAVLFNLRVLWGETIVVENPNDSALHLSMVQWARHLIDAGRVPLDGWFPYLGLGSAHFHHYQTLPHVVTAYLALLFGTSSVYFWSIFLLLALWPISVYLGTRLLGWDRWTSAVAAGISPFLVSASGFGFEHSSYVWRGWGLWPQLWGMWLLPLGWGLGWRPIRGAGSLALAGVTGGAAIACHSMPSARD